MTSKTYPDWVADFETTQPQGDETFTRVWCWALAEVTNDDNPLTYYNLTIDDFMSLVSKQNMKIWFHNLNFDGGFIIDWLLRRDDMGFTVDTPKPGQWSLLASFTNELYQIKVVWPSGITTLFQDSIKKIAMSVARVAQTFDLTETKGDIDHTKYRPVGYEPTPQEWDYVRRDVHIMSYAMHQRLKDGDRLTSSADALKHYKYLMGRKTFEKLFPVLNPDTDELVRSAYRGGFTYANPAYQHTRGHSGHVYDVNSLYPSVMYNRLLPYGIPRLFNGSPPTIDECCEVYIVSITFTAKVKHDHIPTIQLKNNPRFRGAEYLTTIDEPTTIAVTNIDLALMFDHYDLHIWSYNGGLVFDATTGLFDEYINHWSHIKENSSGGAREIAKLFLNSLYGKFGTNPDVTPRIPYLDDDTNALRFTDGDDETQNPVYTAIAVFVTSYGRDTTIRAAQKHYHRFMYADTDSLHLAGDDQPDGLDIHPTKMGCWDHEYRFVDSVFLRAKQYGEVTEDGDTVIRIAGAPQSITETMSLDDMVVGRTFYGKLQRTYQPGGVVLKETHFTLN